MSISKLTLMTKMINIFKEYIKKMKFAEIVKQEIGNKSELSLKEINCPDCFVAKIEIEIYQNFGHIKYLENSIVDYKNRHVLDKKLKAEDYPIIAIVLESPHIEEFDAEVSPLKNPFSANILNDYLNKNLFYYITATQACGNVFFKAIRNIENGIYRIKLVNAVQFQCSLGKSLKEKKNQKIKNDILEKCLSEKLFQEDLVSRIKDASIIINCCTGQKDGKISGAQRQVQNIIDINYPSKRRLYGYHPSSLHFLRGFKDIT